MIDGFPVMVTHISDGVVFTLLGVLAIKFIVPITKSDTYLCVHADANINQVNGYWNECCRWTRWLGFFKSYVTNDALYVAVNDYPEYESNIWGLGTIEA